MLGFEYIHLVIPALVKLTDSLINDPDQNINILIQISPPSGSGRSKLAVQTVETLCILLQTIEMNPNSLVDTSVNSNSALPSRVVQPFLRMLGGNTRPNKDVGTAIIKCLCICVRQLGAGRWVSFYHETARGAIIAWQSKVGIERLQEEQGPIEMMGHAQHLPIDLYDGVVDEISFSGSARWEMWHGGSNDEGKKERGGKRRFANETNTQFIFGPKHIKWRF